MRLAELVVPNARAMGAVLGGKIAPRGFPVVVYIIVESSLLPDLA